MPSRQDLIAAALAEGRIDNVTSLVYRAEALFDLPELPAEFAGAPSLFEDTTLFNQIVDLLPTLSPADQARLRPFIARPTEPDSIFASGGLPAAGRSSRLMAIAGAESGLPLTAAVDECRNWADSGAQSAHFKVWACAGADPQADKADVASVATTMDDLSILMTKPMPDGMGQPLADGRGPNPGPEFGGDGRIDVYLLTLEQAVFRAGHLAKLPGGPSAAAALPSEPYEGNKASGFMLLNRLRIADGDAFRNDLIHEFFHVLQYGHNRKAWLMGETQHWFAEASATWAETFYGKSSLVHGWFNDFQLSPLGLESTDLDHTYAAYVWPIFMEQETGSAAAMFSTWQAIENVGAGDFTGVSDTVDAQLKFADRFRDFAVRNLNREILGEVTKPQTEKRYQQLDPSIPDNIYPLPMAGHAIELGPPKRSATVTIPPLAARYFYFAGTDLARFVTLDLAALLPADALDADVLAHVKDHWERRPVDGSKFTYCRDLAEDDIDQLYLVVSNHSREDGSTITGDVVTTAAGCGGFVGEISYKSYCGPAFEFNNKCITETKATGVRFELIGTQGAVSYYQPVAGTVTDHLENAGAGQGSCTLIYDGTSSIPEDIYAQPNPSALGSSLGLRIDATNPEAPLYSASSLVRMRRSISGCGSDLVAEINLSWIELSDPEGGEGLPVTFEGKTWVLAGTIPSVYGGGPGWTWRFTGSP